MKTCKTCRYWNDRDRFCNRDELYQNPLTRLHGNEAVISERGSVVLLTGPDFGCTLWCKNKVTELLRKKETLGWELAYAVACKDEQGFQLLSVELAKVVQQLKELQNEREM